MNAAIVGLTWGYAKLVGGAWKAGGWKTAVARGVSNFAGALSDFQIHVSPVGMRMHVGDSYQYHNGDTVTWHAGGKTHTIHGSAWDFLKPGGSSAAALKAKEAAGHGYVLTTEDNGDVKMKANQVLNKITADHGHGPALGDPPPDGSWTTEAVEISLKAGEDPNLEAVIKMDKTGLLIHDKDLVQLWTNEGANPDAKIRLDKENITLEAKGISHLTSKHIYLTADRNLYLDAKSHMTFTSKDLMYISSEKDLHLNADGDFDITTDGTCEINGKKIKIG
jgi:hypothetical protein